MTGVRAWMAGRIRRQDRGVGTVHSAIAVLAVVGVTVVGVWIAGWASTARKAQDAADLSALAAARAFVDGGDACGLAAQTATRNGAHLVGCTVTGELPSFGIEVEVSMGLRPTVSGGADSALEGLNIPRIVQASAVAGVP